MSRDSRHDRGQEQKSREREQLARLNLSMEIECKLIYRSFDNDHSHFFRQSHLSTWLEVEEREREIEKGGGGGRGVGPDANESVKTRGSARKRERGEL